MPTQVSQPIVLRLTSSDASQACSVPCDRLNGSPEAKLIKSTAAMRLSLNACNSVGFAAVVKRSNSHRAWRAIIAARRPARCACALCLRAVISLARLPTL
jgi:hypothetical protein